MRAAIYTLGCKVNQYETQAMEQELRRRGHELVDFEDSADAYIINTCSVTAVSDKKSRQMIRRAKRRSPNAVVAVPAMYERDQVLPLPSISKKPRTMAAPAHPMIMKLMRSSGWCARSCFFSFVSVLPDGACMGLVAFGDLAPDNFFCSIIS